jgi:hypothetical protein
VSVVAERAPVADDELVLLTNDAMRARRRPGAVIALWAWETVIALIVAWPASALVRSAYGEHPRGDAPLFSPGGLVLTDFLSNASHGIAPVMAVVLVVVLLSAVIGLVPLAGMLVSIAFSTRLLRAPGPRATLARALRAFRPLALVLVLSTVTQAALWGIGFALGNATASGLAERAGEARAQQLGWIVTLLFALLVGLVGVVQDLARAAIVRFRVRGTQGIRLGLNAFRRAPSTTFWSWAWRALAACLPVVTGALVADKIGGRGGLALVALLAIHQLIVAARIALRASWLARALRAVDHAHRVYRAVPVTDAAPESDPTSAAVV